MTDNDKNPESNSNSVNWRETNVRSVSFKVECVSGQGRMRREANVKGNGNLGHKHIISTCVMPVIEKDHCIYHISQTLEVSSLQNAGTLSSS